jgi:hypothetical protein
MSLVLEYRNTKADLLAQHELLPGDAYRAARSTHYQTVAFGSGMLLLAGYAAFQADEDKPP